MSVPTPIEVAVDPSPWRKDLRRMGLYRGTVVSVDDPQKRGRIQVRITLLHPASAPPGTVLDAPNEESKVLTAPPGDGVPDEACPWAEPCFPWGGYRNSDAADGNQTEGFFGVPSVGSTVWVGFDQGHTGRPVWLGTWYTRNQLPEEITDPSQIRLMKTPGDNLLLFDDATPRIFLATPVGTPPRSIRFIELNDSTQQTTIHNSTDNDQKIILDEHAKTLTIRNSPTQSITQVQDAKTTTIVEGDSQVDINSTSGVITVDNMSSAAKITLTQTQIIITVGSVTLTLDTSTGNVTLVAPGDVDVQAGGDVKLGVAAALGVMLDTTIALFNSHTHPGDSGGTTGVPNQSLVIGTHSSTTVKAKV